MQVSRQREGEIRALDPESHPPIASGGGSKAVSSDWKDSVVRQEELSQFKWKEFQRPWSQQQRT